MQLPRRDGDPARTARRRPGRLPAPAGGAELPAADPAPARAAAARRRSRGRRPLGARRPRSRSRSTSARSRRWPRTRGSAPRAEQIRERARAPQDGHPRASTGSTTPRASSSGFKAFRELLAEDRLSVPGDGDGAGRHAQPRARRALPGAAGEGRARGGPDQRRVRPGRRTRRALSAPVVQPQRAGRAVLRRRRDDGDPAARRHEPGGQGVRGGPGRSRRRSGAVRVRRCRRRAAAGVPVQPARPAGASRTR